MNKALLKKNINSFVSSTKKHPEKYNEEYKERLDLISYYQAFTKEKILSMSEEDVFEYISKLWAMLMWGNKHYRVDKILEEHGLDIFRGNLANLVWGEQDIINRWNNFRKNIKGMGPAMMSEILCKTHPNDFILWSRRIYDGLNYLEVKDLPRYDYQLSGKVFKNLCNVCKEISKELKEAGSKDTNFLAVDYFIWELQKTKTEPPPTVNSEFIHDDVRDKLRDIGEWLGFAAKIEQKVSEGSKVDTIWEATIGNMGRVIYIFEVQTKGSIDSLILNLLKSLNNPSVQGVVAVSDQNQLEKIHKYASDVKDLKEKLKYWDYEEILKVHESLEFTNESINKLGSVPQGF